MPSDRKLQSASNKHGQCVEYIARRVRGGIELRNTWEMVQHDVFFFLLAMSQCTPDVALIDVLVEDLKKSKKIGHHVELQAPISIRQAREIRTWSMSHGTCGV